MIDEEKHDARLIEGIYSALFGGSSWQAWLNDLETRFPGARFAFWGQDVRSKINLGIVHAWMDAGFIDSWTQYYSSINPWQAGILSIPNGIAWTTDHILDRKKLQHTEYYHDWVRPQEDISAGVGIKIFSDANRFFVLTANIRVKDEQRYVPRLQEKMRMIEPHLARAFELSRHLQPIDSRGRFEDFLEALPLATLALNGFGKFCFMNERARQQLSKTRAVSLATDGRVVLADPDSQRVLDATVQRMLASLEFIRPVTIALQLSEDPGEHKLLVVPCPAAVSRNDMSGLGGMLRPTILLFLEEGQIQAKARVQQALKTKFDLTPSEAEVAWQLYGGQTLAQLSSARRISLHTARNHLRNIFAKTGTNRQQHLVRLIADLSISDHNDN